ncbi:MAG: hypothetical protein ACXACI_06140 [Candidatus Hodarchaeales archaeon]
MSSWQDVLKAAANSIGLDVLLFLINDLPATGYYRTFSVRTLAGQTTRSHTCVAKAVRRLDQLNLIHLADEVSPGKALNVRLQAHAPLNRFLMKGALENGENLPVLQIPQLVQQKLAEAHRANQQLHALNTRWQSTIKQLAKKHVAAFYRAGFDFARISNLAAERFEAALPTFRHRDDRSLARLLETILEETARQDVEAYIQVLCGG